MGWSMISGKKEKDKRRRLVKNYVHSKGVSKLAGKALEKKDDRFVKNRILLVALLLVFIIPGLYFCFF